jgi:hypothetical protein
VVESDGAAERISGVGRRSDGVARGETEKSDGAAERSDQWRSGAIADLRQVRSCSRIQLHVELTSLSY